MYCHSRPIQTSEGHGFSFVDLRLNENRERNEKNEKAQREREREGHTAQSHNKSCRQGSPFSNIKSFSTNNRTTIEYMHYYLQILFFSTNAIEIRYKITAVNLVSQVSWAY